MKKEKLDPIKSKILTVLLREGEFMTTAEVAEEAGISWNTAFAHLRFLHHKRWIQKEGETTIYWRAVPEQ